MNLLDIFEGREPHQQAIDRLEQARIAHLEEKMDYYAQHGMAKEFKAAKEERDSYFKARELDEGEMKRRMHADAERMSREAFCKKYGEEDWVYEFWDAVNGSLDEAGIGQDIVNKTEKMARATPPSKAGAVASTVKQAAKWLAGKGGPGREGPTYEAAQKKNSKEVEEDSKLHDLGVELLYKKARAAHPLANNDAEALALYIADKEQRDVDHLERENEQEEEMIARIMDQLKKKELDEHGGGGGGPRQWHAYVKAHRTDEGNPNSDPWYVFAKQNPMNYKKFKTYDGAKAYADKHGLTCASAGYFHDKVKPQVNEADRGVESTIRTLMAPAYEEETGGMFGYTLEKKAPTMAALREKFHDDLNAILTQASPKLLAQAAQELKDMYGQVAEGWSDAIVAQRTGRPRTPYSVYIKGKKWKDFENEDHAENVANKLRAKFKADGRDPSVITIAPTDYDKGLDESKEAVFRSHDIEVEYPEGKGHSHIYHRREPYRLSTIFSDANSVAARNRRAKISLFVDGEYIPNYEWQEGVDAPGGGIAEHGGGVNSMKQYIAWRKSANKERGITKKQPVGKMAPQGRAVPKGTVHGKLDQSRGVIPSSSFHEDETVAETVTDVRAGMAKIYNKLAPKIERYKDSFLANQLYDELEAYAELHGAEREFRQIMATARGRAHMEYDTNPGGFQNWFWFLPFGDEVEEWANTAPGHDLGQQKLTAVQEDQDTSGVESAIIRRIMVAHLDWLQKFGPEKVMQAAEEVAYNVGDVDEIGTSDVSAYVHEVGQILGVDQLDEKWSAKYKRSIDCSHPKGFSQRAHCAGRKK